MVSYYSSVPIGRQAYHHIIISLLCSGSLAVSIISSSIIVAVVLILPIDRQAYHRMRPLSASSAFSIIISISIILASYYSSAGKHIIIPYFCKQHQLSAASSASSSPWSRITHRPAGISYHHITISPYHHITISPYHHITISPYHHIIISSFHHIIISSYHHIIISSYHHIIISSYHHIIISSYHHIIISSSSAVSIMGCQHHHQHHRRRGPRSTHRPACISS